MKIPAFNKQSDDKGSVVEGTSPAPVPEMMDATQLAAAIAEPDGHDWSVALPPIG